MSVVNAATHSTSVRSSRNELATRLGIIPSALRHQSLSTARGSTPPQGTNLHVEVYCIRAKYGCMLPVRLWKASRPHVAERPQVVNHRGLKPVIGAAVGEGPLCG